MNFWGRVVATRARTVLALASALIAAAAVYGLGVFGSLSNGGFEDPASDSARGQTLIDQHFPGSRVDVVAIYHSDRLTVTEPAFERAVATVVDDLPAEAVAGAVTYYDTKSPALVGDNGHATRVLITLRGGSQDELSTASDAVKDRLDAPGLDTKVGGMWAVYGDVNQQASRDIGRAETLTLPIVLLLSLVIFGSLTAALMPTLVGAIAVFGAFALVRALTTITDVSVFAINVITLLGMGLAIDYALFVVSRFREELGRQPDASRASVRAATAAAVATAGRTVLFSGLIVAAAMSSLLVFPQGFLKSMGLGGMAAVLVAMAAALTVLPALLTVLGPRIEWGRMPWRRGLHSRLARAGRGVAGSGMTSSGATSSGSAAATSSIAESAAAASPGGSPTSASSAGGSLVGAASADGAWARVAHSVMRRPWLYLVTITAGLLLIAAPFTGARWGGVDERVLPAGSPSRLAADAQARWFGGDLVSAPVVVTGASAPEAQAYADRLAGRARGRRGCARAGDARGRGYRGRLDGALGHAGLVGDNREQRVTGPGPRGAGGARGR